MSRTSRDTRKRILDTARALFHARGYNDVGVNDVCAEAKVVKGSFYHFFSSKDALLEAVIDDNRDRLLAGLADLAASPANGREQLVAQLEAAVKKSRAQKKAGAVLGCDIGSLASELAAVNDTARKATRRAFRTWLAALEESVRQGIRDKSLAPGLDPATTAVSLLAVMQGMSTVGRSFSEPAQLGRIAREAQERLLPPP